MSRHLRAFACVAAFTLVAFRRRAGTGQIVKAFLGLVITTVLVVAAAVSLLATYLPWQRALYHALGAWPHVGNSSVTGMQFYRVCTGLDEPLQRLATLIFWLCVQVLLVRLALRRAFRRRLCQIRPVDLILVVLAVAIVGVHLDAANCVAAFSPLPVWLGVAVVLGLCARRHPDYQHCRDRVEMGLVLGVFAIAMLAKMPMNARIYHYGFVLAMPGVLAMVVACWWVKNEVRRRGGSGVRFAAVPGAFLASVAVLHLLLMADVIATKDAPIQTGGTPRLRATSEQAAVFSTMLPEIKARTDGKSTLAVWPEGALVNFLTRRQNATPYTVLIPPEIAMFGEETILESYRNSPPDFVLFVNRDASEYGVGSFQEGYARRLWQWLRRNYRVIRSVGADLSQSGGFGMTLMKRLTKPQSPS